MSLPSRLVPLVLIVGLASPAWAQNDLCLAEAAGFTSGGNSCTASDISIKQIVVGVVLDGCTNSMDTALVEMSAEVEVSGGGRKYDIATFLNLEGGSAFSGTSECFRDFFDPNAIPAEGTDEDGDQCHDVNGSMQSTATAILGPIEIACSESGTPNGVVDFSGCVSYVQNANGINCQSLADAVPLTTSKCGCSDQEIAGLSLPELTLTKTCSRTELSTANPTSTCTITYQNLSSLSVADFHSFRDDYDETKVTVGNFSVPGGDDVQDNGDIITWTIGGAPPALAANIPTLSTGTMTYDMTLLGTVSTNDTVFNEVCSYWKDSVEPLCASYAHNVGPTAAVISGFEVEASANGTILRFRTESETGTLGFQVERFDHGSGTFVSVGKLIDTVEFAPVGGDYQIFDPHGKPSDRYRIVEFEVGNQRQLHSLQHGTGLSDNAELKRDFEQGARRFVRTAKGREVHATAPSQPLRINQTHQQPGPAQRLVVNVDREGLQRLEASVLANAFGLTVNQVKRRLKTERLNLRSNGAPVSWWTTTGGELFFYGVVSDDPFSLATAYWLDLHQGSSAAIERLAKPWGALIDEASSTIQFEEDNLPILAIAESSTGDFWYWNVLRRDQQTQLNVTVPDPNPLAQAQLSGDYGTFFPDPGGVLSVSINGQPLGSAQVAVSGTGAFSLPVPAGVLTNGQNTVELALNDQTVIIAPNALTLSYRRLLASNDGHLAFDLAENNRVHLSGFATDTVQLLDVSDVSNPLRLIAKGREEEILTPQLGPGSYYAADQAFTPSVRAYSVPIDFEPAASDMLIVTHASLLDSSQAYADYRRQQGLDVTVLTQQQAFDLYSYSLPNPDAIRQLAETTASASAGRLRGLFIIGSGTFDHRDLLGVGDNLVLAPLQVTGFGMVGADRLYVEFDEDETPEIPVGRLPARTETEVDDYLQKVTEFEGSSGSWRQRDLLFSDNADSSGDYPEDSSALVPYLRDPEFVHLGATHTLGAARQALLDAWEDGIRLATYYGHGSGLSLAHENLFQNSSLDVLPAVESTPMLTALTCNIGRFDFPGVPGLGSQLVLNPKGAVAVWSAAGLSVQTRAREATASFLQLLQQDPQVSIGRAIMTVSRQAGPTFRESAPSLLGDPLLTLE